MRDGIIVPGGCFGYTGNEETEMLHGTMKKWVGTRQFYKRLLYMAVPIMVQNLITNFVGFLDNIMVGQLGTSPMAAK